MNLRKRPVKPRSSKNVHSAKPPGAHHHITKAAKARSTTHKFASSSPQQRSLVNDELDWEDGSNLKVVIWKGESQKGFVNAHALLSNEKIAKGIKPKTKIADGEPAMKIPSLKMVPSEDDNTMDSTFEDEHSSLDMKLELLNKQLHRLEEDLARVVGTPKPVQKFDRFMDLPREIRMMIYEYLLVKGKVFPHANPNGDPRYAKWEEYKRPEIQLFAVNHQVKLETEKMYYSKNLFVLPSGIVSIAQTNDLLFRSYLFPRASLEYVRSLSICFDTRDLEPNSHWCLFTSAEKGVDDRRGKGTFKSLAPDERQRIIHRQARTVLVKVVWAQKFGDNFKSMTLNLLQVDLSRCYCTYGCHRYAADAAALLGPFKTNPPKRIEIIGAQDMRERNEIWTNIMTANHPHKPAVYFPDWADGSKEVDDMELAEA
ncbi:MAG: hypothetical protein M1812_003604 [Candelaria pacifica]|nr:MAG: hypothetical protein M1812_003604 [Candelaria pacifica]